MRNIAHRGASGHAPENTRTAFDLAIAMGADAIETDVQLTADGVPVLFHDDRVDRTSDGHGPVNAYDLDSLRSLDIGSWYRDGAVAVAVAAPWRVMTLAEAVTDFLPRIPFAVEIKDPRAAAATIDILTAAPGSWEITSFSWGALLDARTIDPGASFGFLTPVFDDDIIGRCVAAGFRQICPRVDTLDAGLVARAHDAGLDVRAWGVRSREDVARLFRTGADGATVNWPAWIQEYRATLAAGTGRV